MVILNELAALGTIELRRDSTTWNAALIRGRGRVQVSATHLADALRALLKLAQST